MPSVQSVRGKCTTALLIFLILSGSWMPNPTLPVLTSPHMSSALTYLSPLHACIICTVHFRPSLIWLSLSDDAANFKSRHCFVFALNHIWVRLLLSVCKEYDNVFCSVDDCDTSTEGEWWPLFSPLYTTWDHPPPPPQWWRKGSSDRWTKTGSFRVNDACHRSSK